jgi:hypothetical protein
MKNKEIREILNKSSLRNPVIIRTKYGFTKFWKENDIQCLSWGKNWSDKNPSMLDLDSAADIVLNSSWGILL